MESLKLLVRISFFIIGVILVIVEVKRHRAQPRSILGNIAYLTLGAVALINIVFMVFLWVNHVNFPLNLKVTEGVIFQSFQRAVEGLYIYPEPSPEYIPWAYNPLFYIFAVPFSWIFGVKLFTLRLVAILGMLGCILILYRVVQYRTGSVWWGLITIGLFVGAYFIMDAHLDTAHSDSWLLCSALLGSYIISRNRSRIWNVIGVVILVAAFWFKQHGALFAIGGVIFLTWRDGLKQSIPYWIVAAVLGPILYIFAGPWLFGPYFHYFTWEVPSQWSELNIGTFSRYITFIVRFYPLLALSGFLWAIWAALNDRKSITIWHVQFIVAAFTGFMGTLDSGSSDNVYIPMSTWFILMGILGLYELFIRVKPVQHFRIHLLVLFFLFTIIAYNPLKVIVSPRSHESYVDLVGLLRSLKGNVYAPSLGQMQKDFKFYPAAHWGALEDMIRGPGRDTRNHPNTRRLLDTVLHPQGQTFILTNAPLHARPWMAFLENYYVLSYDFGDRFKPLRVLPARWDHRWPRYLYRFAPEEVSKGPIN